MGKKFDITSFRQTLNGPNVSDSDTGRKRIEYIDESLIDDDPENFYSIAGIDELADKIAFAGLQQPVVLRPNPETAGRYIIVSGHRRMAAIRKLMEADADKWRRVPCIVEVDDCSPAVRKLRLVFANSDTRKLTSAEIGRQAAEVQELLYQLAEEGYEFPGRMRDTVAEVCGVSRTKLATIAAIKNNLPQPFLGQWERGELTESAAYELSKIRSEYAFLCIEEAIGEKYIITGNVAKKLADHADALLENHAKHRCPNGTTCQNTIGFFKGAAKQRYEYDVCDGTKCCVDCWRKGSCPGICSVVRQQKKEDAAERKLELQERAEREERERSKVQRIMTLWNRFGEARARADKSVEECFHALDRYYSDSSEEEVVRRECLEGKFNAKTKLPYGCCCYLGDVERYVKIADLLDVSIDYLLCRTDNPQGFCQQPEGQLMICGWMPGGTYPREPGDVVAAFDSGDGVILRKICYYADGQYFFKKSGAVIDAKCVKWLQLPQDE